jgi:protein-S-isoprenylcysteine O-methyltransferase Ste14
MILFFAVGFVWRAWLQFFSIRAQVFEEEEYLIKTYGDEYRDFATRIGRFLPMLGKLRFDG